jgi:hypothetical protein
MGMHRITGETISGLDELSQNIRDILTTPIGSRVMNRDYGASLFELIDQPGNNSTLLKIYAAVVDSLLRWEPRILPLRVQLAGGDLAAGQFDIDIEGITTTDIGDIDAGDAVQLIIPLGAS